MNFNLTNEEHLLCDPLEEFENIDEHDGTIFRLSDEGHLLCYPLEEFKSIDGIEGMILSLEKDGRFPSRDRVKRLFFRTYILSHSNATVTDKEYIRCVNLINEVYASNGWT